MIPELPNGIYDALCRASYSRTGISALDLVTARYENSRQVATKCRTIYARQLRRAALRGWFRQVGTSVSDSRFYLTEAGRRVALHEAERRRLFEQSIRPDRGTFPRLAE